MAILLPFQTASAAGFSTKAKGTTSANFLKLAPGARAIAMGEAYSALTDDSLALYWNPAGLSYMASRHSVNFMHALYVEEINFGYAAYAAKLPNNLGSIATSVHYLNVGAIDQTDTIGNPIGSYSPKDAAYALGWGGKFFGLGFGLSGKYISSKILNSASTYAADIGVQARQLFSYEKLTLAATAKNIGPGLKFHQERDPLPFEFRLGSSYLVVENLPGSDYFTHDSVIATMDAVFPIDNEPYGAFGLEHAKIFGDIPVAGRLGFNSRSWGDLSGFSGVSLGFGTIYKNLTVDYTLAPLGELGLTHRMSVGYAF
ncbi:MAG: PorV/PorQ family protein [Elusimicrobia bacterium]|nr:PorV/PorQ family protein [Elusimicrobiota bacterium]